VLTVTRLFAVRDVPPNTCYPGTHLVSQFDHRLSACVYFYPPFPRQTSSTLGQALFQASPWSSDFAPSLVSLRFVSSSPFSLTRMVVVFLVIFGSVGHSTGLTSLWPLKIAGRLSGQSMFFPPSLETTVRPFLISMLSATRPVLPPLLLSIKVSFFLGFPLEIRIFSRTIETS